jgi:hypothetical protein
VSLQSTELVFSRGMELIQAFRSTWVLPATRHASRLRCSAPLRLPMQAAVVVRAAVVGARMAAAIKRKAMKHLARMRGCQASPVQSSRNRKRICRDKCLSLVTRRISLTLCAWRGSLLIR